MISQIGMMQTPIKRSGKKAGVFDGREGFTLIELVLVVLILLIIIGIATPALRGTYAGLAVKSASFDIAKEMNFAAEMAIITRENYRANFDYAAGRVWITKRTTTATGVEYVKIRGRQGRSVTLPAGIALKGTSAEVSFYPDGRCDPAEITVLDRKGAGYLLHLGGMAGNIEISEAHP